MDSWHKKECPNVTVPTIFIVSPLRVIVHAAHAWKCTKDAQIRVGRSEDREHKTLSVSLCWDSFHLQKTLHIGVLHIWYVYRQQRYYNL